MKNEVLIVIPAYNEAENIGEVLQAIQNANLPADILVVNDGSTDATASIARENGAIVVSHPYNLRYGAAIQTGFKYALACDYQYVIQFDADGQHDVADLATIITTLKSKRVSLVIGSRYLGKGTIRVGIIKKMMIVVIRGMIRFFTGESISDPTSGLKGVARPLFSYYAKMGNYPFDFPDADVLIHSLRQGVKLLEVPANMHERMAGRSMFAGLKPIYYVIRLVIAITVVLIQDKCKYKDVTRQ